MGPWLRAKRHAYYIHTQGSDTNCVTYNIWILEELQIAIIYRFQLQERPYTIFREKIFILIWSLLYCIFKNSHKSVIFIWEYNTFRLRMYVVGVPFRGTNMAADNQQKHLFAT